MLIIDSETLMMLLLLQLTPKEAAPLLGSCKKLHSSCKGFETMSASEYARKWAKEYAKLYVSVKHSVVSIGRLLVCEYPRENLLKTTISIVDEGVHVWEEDFVRITYTCVHTIKFFKQGSVDKAVAIFSWNKTQLG
jgi:hypothetical protein